MIIYIYITNIITLIIMNLKCVVEYPEIWTRAPISMAHLVPQSMAIVNGQRGNLLKQQVP